MADATSVLTAQRRLVNEAKRLRSNFKKDAKHRKTKQYFELRTERAQQLLDEFEKNHRALYEITGTNVDEYFDSGSFEESRDDIFMFLCELREGMESLQDHSHSESNDSGSSATTGAPQGPSASMKIPGNHESYSEKPQDESVNRLPRIEMKKFSGDYGEWPSFRDLFMSIVGENPNVKPIEKLHYLKTHLDGDAEKVIRHFTVTAENYEAAFGMLCERYENKRALVNRQLQQLFLAKSCSEESAASIRCLIDTFKGSLRALQSLKIETAWWDVLMNYMVVSRLPATTRNLWEQEASNFSDLPTFEQLMNFLEHRFRALEVIGNSGAKHRERQALFTTVTCCVCKGPHSVSSCDDFKTKPIQDRIKIVRSRNLCFNCLKSGHNSSKCSSTNRCRQCQRKHHSLIHTTSQLTATTSNLDPTATNFEMTDPTPTVEINAMSSTMSHDVLLATAAIRVRNRDGAWITLRALVDSGSQATFISERVVQLLQLKRRPYRADIVGVGGNAGSTKTSIDLHILLNDLDRLDVKALVLGNLTRILPSRKVDVRHRVHFRNLTLADPDFATPSEIDILLGADVYAEIVIPEIIRESSRSLIAQNTRLGWIIFGNIENSSSDRIECHTVLVNEQSDMDSLNQQLKTFWELEEIGAVQPNSEEDQICEEHFRRTHSRLPTGRYVVKLPFRNGDAPEQLGNSRNGALASLLQLERRFKRDADYQREYLAIIQEYLKLGHMQVIDEDDCRGYYLPHHAVRKNDSATTKLRIVFDASRKTDIGISLNDCLMTGPTLQADLVGILLRWRLHKYVVTADVEKMYRQVHIHPSRLKYHLILMRFSESQPITVLTSTTVTFGETCGAFLAIRAMRQLAEDHGAEFPEGKIILLEEFYIDNMFTGASTLNAALEKRKQIQALTAKGCFHLYQWATNDDRLLARVDENQRGNSSKHLVVSTDYVFSLGLLWLSKEDSFSLKVRDPDPITTKREMLSQIARIFDPLGWIAPITSEAKVLMQRLWLLHLGWDEKYLVFEFQDGLSINQTFDWKFIASVMHRYRRTEPAYSRIITLGGRVVVSLLMSKSKVVPLKPLSVPRLELCAAVLGARLVESIVVKLKLAEIPCVMWTDSTVVKAWLSKPPNNWNRVTTILEKVPDAQWRHVSSKEDPADLITRSDSKIALSENQLWWSGPSWLSLSSREWPNRISATETHLEVRKYVSHTALLSMENDTLQRFSTFTNLIRVTAYCLRFVNHCRKRPRKYGSLQPEELNIAKMMWVRWTQYVYFNREMEKLEKQRPITSSHILRLDPFLDQEGVLRVGGRLEHANLHFNQKHPIILPRTGHFSKIVMQYYHKITLHGGPQLMIATLRNAYWIVGARNMAKKVVHDCIICFRHRLKSTEQLMGMLPSFRVTPFRPFLHTGVDYCGPLLVKVSKRRNAPLEKAYIAVFICLSVKAIHLEVVSDMSMETFLAVFRRFVSRRGLPSDVYSDCGTNFVAANRELRSIVDHQLRAAELLAADDIKWHFNPPASPHFGGLWEAGVKSTKYHIKRLLAGSHFTFEETITVITQIESMLNSRPIASLSDDISDLAPLTPGHFLIGEPLNAVPERNVLDLKDNYLNRWQRAQKAVQAFWKRWHTEYLSRLQQRPKWCQRQPNLEKGALVLLKDDGSSPNRWRLARIIDVHPGQDGLVRVVTVRTAANQFKRPINKVCPLPIDRAAS